MDKELDALASTPTLTPRSAYLADLAKVWSANDAKIRGLNNAVLKEQAGKPLTKTEQALKAEAWKVRFWLAAAHCLAKLMDEVAEMRPEQTPRLVPWSEVERRAKEATGIKRFGDAVIAHGTAIAMSKVETEASNVVAFPGTWAG